jgi:hypothetical protein
MSRSREEYVMYRFKAFGLTLMAVIGLMAFAALGAQAENLTPTTHAHGDFLVLGSSALAVGVKLTGEQVGEGSFLIPNKSFEFVCKKGIVTSAEIKAGLGEAHASVEFKECKVFKITNTHPYILEGEITPCTNALVQPITANFIVLVVKHGGEVYLVGEPLTNPLGGGSFTTIEFSPSTCALPEAATIKGTIGAKRDNANSQLTHTLDLKTSETLVNGQGTHDVQLLLGTALSYGGNLAYITGKVNVFTTGAKHPDANWGVC